METRRLLTPPSCDALWDHYYLVKLPYLQTRSVEHIRRFGIRISEVGSWTGSVTRKRS